MQSRLCALLIGILALAALRGRFDMLPGPLTDRLWHLSGDFAVPTGLVAAAAFLAVARFWRIGPRAAGALITALALVALTTPSLPAPLWPLSDPMVAGRTGLALALPSCALFWWIAFAPKNLTLRDLPLLVAWPVAFAAQALMRGQSLPLAPLLLALPVALAVIGLARLAVRRSGSV